MTRVILDNTPKEPTPLVSAIGALGVDIMRGEWQPGDALLARTEACFVSLYDCMKRPLDVWRLKRRLARHGVPLVSWNRDAPGYMNKAVWRLALVERARPLDIYASHSLADGRRFGATQLLLQNAALTEHYHLGGLRLEELEDSARYRHDVGFFGALDGARYREYRARVEFFGALGNRLAERGIKLSVVDTLSHPLDRAEQRALIQATRINLNFGAGCEYGRPVGHGLPERCFGVPACGGFLLSDRRVHAADAFEPGTEWADYADLDEAVAQIVHFLADFGAARAIAARAHARVLREHTYRHRAEQMLGAIERWRAARRRAA
jgi:spore maturation protein CgeB